LILIAGRRRNNGKSKDRNTGVSPLRRAMELRGFGRDDVGLS
jgi:hypothetical protein